mgnify:CR=1 FL=1
MNIKPHWMIVNPEGEIVGVSINDRTGAWADAERACEELRDELWDRGCVCIHCDVREVSE